LHYVGTGWFFVDIVSCLPFDIMVQSATNNTASLQLVKVIRLLRLIKLFRMITLFKYLHRLEEYLELSPAVVSLLYTIVQVIFISHMMCCLWWGLSGSLSSVAWYDSATQVYDTLRNAPFQVRPI